MRRSPRPSTGARWRRASTPERTPRPDPPVRSACSPGSARRAGPEPGQRASLAANTSQAKDPVSPEPRTWRELEAKARMAAPHPGLADRIGRRRPAVACGALSVIDWLLDGDPAIRWQVLRDLTNASPDDVAAARARVEHDGWGARLFALEDPDGLWAGGACFPASYTGGEPGQPWTATMHTLQTLQLLGLDPASESARRAIALVAANGRWEHAGQRYFDGEVEPCINGRTIEAGAYFGVDVAAIVERILAERLEDGGWNCEVENGSVRSSFDTTINVLDGLLEF